MRRMERKFRPSVTVAAVIEKAGRYMLVEEETFDGLRYNQPAGHLEAHESLTDAVIREVREETTCAFTPTACLGAYLCASMSKEGSETTYLRFAFVGELGQEDQALKLDEGIVRTLWLSPDEIRALAPRHRSPLVMRCVDDHVRGKAAMPLDFLVTHESALGAA
jgi:8-oxo-dGTP pyrophosphatase MutT (NUDIX family)